MKLHKKRRITYKDVCAGIAMIFFMAFCISASGVDCGMSLGTYVVLSLVLMALAVLFAYLADGFKPTEREKNK